jgi:predicted dehydrogenase
MGKKQTRRTFLKTAAFTTAGLGMMTAKSYSSIIGANDRIRFAVAGLHGRGREHIKSISACENAVVSHICDVDQRELDSAAGEVTDLFGSAPVAEKDVRKILASREVDILTIATPEHWHAPMAIMALQAGKHVYVEKPCSHDPAEGIMLVAAQKKYGKLVQMGNQQRSSATAIEAVSKIHDGVIGRAYFGKAWYCNSRKSIGYGKEVAVPDYLDWDLWQGPAPRRPYKDNIHPYNWHWFWLWGTGETLNNGTHEVDICLWALQIQLPVRISASGGRYHYKDDWEFYDTLVTSFEYDDKMITWEGRSCQNMPYFNRGRGVTIHGTEGTVLMDRNGYEIYDPDNKKIFELIRPETDASMDVRGGGLMTDLHFQNLIDGIREGVKLHSPIDEGNISVTMLQLSNIAWKFRRVLDIDDSTGRIRDDAEAAGLWQRTYEPGWEPAI